MTNENEVKLAEHTIKETPKWFRFLTVVVLVWNILGLLAFVGQMMMPIELVNQLPQEQQTYYNTLPFWAIGAFFIAVMAGFIGSVLLMFKKALAFNVFVLSFIGLLIQQFHAFVLANAINVFGADALGMPITIFIVSLFLVWFSKHCIKQGWVA